MSVRIGTVLRVCSTRRVVAGAGFPEDLAEDAEAKLGVRGGKVESADEAANFLVSWGGGAGLGGAAGSRLEIAAGAEGIEQHRGDAFEFGGACGGAFLRLRRGLGIASEFVEADGHGLAEIHRAMHFAGGDAEEPVAMAEIFVGKTAFFRTEQEGDTACGEALADKTRGMFGAFDEVLQFAAADGGGSNNEAAVRDGLGHGLELRGAGEKRRGSDGGTRLAEGQVVGVHDAKVEESEVAHGASGGAEVERVARGDEDDAQTVEFGSGKQERGVYSRTEVRK